MILYILKEKCISFANYQNDIVINNFHIAKWFLFKH